MTNISRRGMLGGVLAGAAVSTSFGQTAQAAEKKTLKRYDSAHFYKDGNFDADVAKQAYYEMMEYHGYPIVPKLKTDEFWAAEFGVGCFSEVGMAGIFWMNRLEDDYFGHEIFLLPGQMIPEHKHVATAAAGPKMEGWHVRHGSIYTYSEGKGSAEDEARIPASHKECANARTAVKLTPGECNYLAGPEQWHYMLAGPEGAIVTEYATYHDGDGLRFSHPDAKL